MSLLRPADSVSVSMLLVGELLLNSKMGISSSGDKKRRCHLQDKEMVYTLISGRDIQIVRKATIRHKEPLQS